MTLVHVDLTVGTQLLTVEGDCLRDVCERAACRRCYVCRRIVSVYE